MDGPRAPLVAALLLALVGVCRGGEPAAFKRAFAAAQRLEGEARVDAQTKAVQALAADADPEAAALLLRLALSRELDWRVRDAAEAGLHAAAGPAVVVWAGEALRTEREASRRVGLCRYLAARAAQGEAGVEAGLLLLPALEDDEEAVQLAAIAGLARVRRPVAVDALVRRLEDASGRVAADCARALAALTGESLPSPQAWVDWWRTRRDGFQLPEGAPEAAGEPEPGRTVTRLAPPGQGGETIYAEVASSKVLFVVDVSGSMQVRCQDSDGRSRTRLDYVKEALCGVIAAQLEPSDRFALIAFSTEVTAWKRKLVKASPANKRAAQAWVAKLAPDGETNIYDTLELALSVEGVDTIYFLSDGTPTAGKVLLPDAVLGDLRKWNAGRGVQLHTIGFLAGDGAPYGVVQDKGMARRFLEALAKAGGGEARIFE